MTPAVPTTGLELSGLVAVRERSLLDARGWDEAFWSACDERTVDQALVLIGHPAGGPADAWAIESVQWPAGEHGATDSEAVAHHDGSVFVIGSHFGSKERFLVPKRAFVARFAERDVAAPGARLDVAQRPFRLLRTINEALNGTPLLELSAAARQRFAAEVRALAQDPDDPGAVLEGDQPIEIEGLAFRAGGTALLGLRYPVSQAGHPIVVEIENFARAAFDAGTLTATARVLAEIGSTTRPLGVRDLDLHEAAGAERLSIVAGPTETDLLASPGDGAKRVPFEHWIATSGGPASLVRVLTGQGHVEGVAWRSGERFAYVTDTEKDDETVLWLDERPATLGLHGP